LAIFPAEQLPKDMLARIDKIMAEKDYRDKAFALYIHWADSLYKLTRSIPATGQLSADNEQLFNDAVYNYKQALSLKPERNIS